MSAPTELERKLDAVKGMLWGSAQMESDWAVKQVDTAIATIATQAERIKELESVYRLAD